jgi:predicted transcriptional regulator
MAKKRSKDQIMALILALCQGEGVNKTKIVYQVGLNFKSIIPYLSLLIEKGHIASEERGLIIYRTTQKGMQVLEALKIVEAIYT